MSTPSHDDWQEDANDLLAAGVDAMGLEIIPPDLYIPVGVYTFSTDVEQPACARWVPAGPSCISSGWPANSIEGCLVELTRERWIRCTTRGHQIDKKSVTCRVYVLPFDVRNIEVPRENSTLQRKLQWVTGTLDTRPEAWGGAGDVITAGERAELLGVKSSESFDSDSLFYIFNTIQSPDPDPSRLAHAYDRRTAERVLSGSHDRELGFATELYAHQRRSIVAMMEREVQPGESPDPRLQRVVGPTGNEYFFDFPFTRFFRDMPTYTDVKGGILAETMGTGKTYMVLGLILATRHQIPDTPVDAEILGSPNTGLGVKSLTDYLLLSIQRHNVNWRQELEEEEVENNKYYPLIYQKMERPFLYKELRATGFSNTRSAPVVDEILLCRTTLVVVPSNLFKQWQHEIEKHVDLEDFRYLSVNENFGRLPSKVELAGYQMILMERYRFAIEMGTRPPLKKDQAEEREFPLRTMHFLRLVMDEGHSFAGSANSANYVSPFHHVRADRRWIVTGTPTSGLVGAEIDLAAHHQQQAASADPSKYDAKAQMHLDMILADRKKRLDGDNEDLKNLGRLVVGFLSVQPWAHPTTGRDKGGWQLYTKLGSGGLGKDKQAATSVRAIMQSLIVRHQFQEIGVHLPRLHNTWVYLEPTVYDKYNMDLFTLVLACNTITSERTDQDYIFERRNWRSLDLVIHNLRVSNFAWFGYKPEDAEKTYGTLIKYKEEHVDMWPKDKLVAWTAGTIIPPMVSDETWCSLNRAAEMGFLVTNLPSQLAAQFGVDPNSKSQSDLDLSSIVQATVDHAVLPATTIITAQTFVGERVSKGQPDPLIELCDESISIANNTVGAQSVLQKGTMHRPGASEVKPGNYRGIPDSGLQQSVTLSQKALSGQKMAAVTAARQSGRKRKHVAPAESPSEGPAEGAMSADRIHVAGTASAKLSYLLSRIIELQGEEKILIFYEGDNVAYYVAQGLEIIGVPHFIYASNIGTKLRSEYHDKFMKDDSPERVMLIDLKQGGQGLNIVSASRIFFVNPVWNASVEAQAIKRAHRIGQTREVHVETLVLKDSIEEKMLGRRSTLSEDEKGRVKSNPLLDPKVRDFLQDFRFRSERGGPTAPTEDRFAPIDPAPLLFPEADQYLRRLAPASEEGAEGRPIKKEDDGEEEAISPPLPPPPPPKKKTRFVI